MIEICLQLWWTLLQWRSLQWTKCVWEKRKEKKWREEKKRDAREQGRKGGGREREPAASQEAGYITFSFSSSVPFNFPLILVQSHISLPLPPLILNIVVAIPFGWWCLLLCNRKTSSWTSFYHSFITQIGMKCKFTAINKMKTDVSINMGRK